MNKFIKLILVFLAIIGIIVGVQFLGKGDSLSDDDDVASTTYEKLGDTFYEEWESQSGWNKQLFNSHFKELDKKFRAGNLTQSQHDRLAENVCTYAINKTEAALLNQWSKSNCNRDYINNHYSGVLEINKLPYIKGDSRITNLQRMKKNYDNIYTFIGGTLKHTTFRAVATVTENYTWQPFSVTEKDVKNNASTYMDMQDYQNYFSKIDYIKTNLSNASNFVNPAANEYYKAVVDGLKSRFTAVWDQKVADKDSTGLDQLTQLMANKVTLLKNECEKYSSSQHTIYNTYVNKKKLDKQDLIDQWREERKKSNILY